MHLSFASTYLLLVSSLVAASPSRTHKDIQQSRDHGRVPAHHVPDQYLSLFDPKKHEHVTAELKSHQEHVQTNEMPGSMQHVLAATVPTNERLALKQNLANIRSQCRHATTESRMDKVDSRRTKYKHVVNSVIERSEAAGKDLFAATALAIGACIGFVALLA